VDFGSGPGVQYPGDKESHRELPGGLDINAGQAMMAERLHELHELHQLQDQIQGLLKDPDFKNTLRDKFTDDQLRRLRDKILNGDKLGRDNDWNKLLQQAVSRNKLDGRQMDILRRWAERSDNKQTNPSGEPEPLSGRPSNPSPASSGSPSSDSISPLPSAGAVEPSMWEHLRDKTSDWIGKNMDGFGGDLVSALAELGINDEGGPLADVLRSLKDPDFPGAGLIEEAAGLSSYLPDMGELIHEQRGAWDDVRSLFRDTHAPSLPSMGGGASLPSLPGTPSTDGGDWSAGSLALLTLGVLLLLVWKMRVGSRGKTTPDASGDWRLGSWPVLPAAVSNRQELVRAFEYLALLCLGPNASTCHHHELADRLAEQQRDDPARSRQAAELLAWFYEQARYAPAENALSQKELREARHALCFLAGVTTI